MSAVAAANVSPASSFPPPLSELCFNNGGCPSATTVFVSWKASDDLPLPPTPITLEYTTDGGVTYSAVPGGGNRNNDGTDGAVSCPVLPSFGTPTGCFAWTTGVPSGLFRVRVRIADADGLVSGVNSDLLNAGRLHVIAGNTDPGLGTSAENVAFGGGVNPAYSSLGTMAASSDGVIYILDTTWGLVRIHPQDGIAKVVLRRQATSLPADFASAPLSAARLGVHALHILFDYDGGLIIHDGTRIRRIANAKQFDTTTLTIDPLIGGGSDVSDTTTASALQISVTASNNLYVLTPTALPNGDLLFQSEYPIAPANDVSNTRVRHYHAATQQVTSHRFTGVGHSGDPSGPLAGCIPSSTGVLFDPATSAITGWLMRVATGSDMSCTANAYNGARFDENGVAVPVSAATQPLPHLWSMRTGRDGRLFATSKYAAQYFQFNPASNN